MDHLLMTQWQRLLELQEVQMELLEELGRKRRKAPVEHNSSQL
jgi:hypothetical protein